MNKHNLLIIMLVILPFTSALAFDFEVNGIYYNVLSENKVEVTSGTNTYAGDIIIPKSVKNNNTVYKIIKIGERAFNGCTELESIEIPNSVITIGGSAFLGCALKDVQIPNSVDTISSGAFAKCNELKEVIIGSDVRKIEGSFRGSDSITSVIILSTTPPTINPRTTFSSNVLNNATLEVPVGSLDAYQNADGWKIFKNIIEGNTPIPNAISINVWNFLDANLRKFLLNESYGKDSIITNEEIANITSLDISNRRLSDLKGIEHFTALKKLLCYKNNLSWVDFSANKNLKELDCYNNQIMGIKMDSLIASLPTLPSDEGSLYVYDATEDNNICCEIQVSEAVAKGWNVYYFTGSDWQQYIGHENGVVIDDYNFPDEIFNALLKKQEYGLDGFITDDEINNLTSLYTGWASNISDLKGIEYFTELTSLSCPYNKLTSLDVSKNAALTELSCIGNQLTSLDVSKNSVLTTLECYNNQLSSLDVSKNTALTRLNCSNNQLTSLDVSKNSALTTLYCVDNQLNNLDVSKNAALTELSCSNNLLESLDLYGCTTLTSLSCNKNQLTSLDMSKNTALTSLDCANNLLTSIDVSKNTTLTSLGCANNQLTSLDVSKNTALISLGCANNQLANLDVSKNTTLEILYCRFNQLTNLDLSKNTALVYLECSYNQLTNLNVSKDTALTQLDCYFNQLVSLDLSKNTALRSLACFNNQLTSLDVSKNLALTSLNCAGNQLTSLDVSMNTALTSLLCYENQIEGIKMDSLVSTLPMQSQAGLYIINLSSAQEGNICTKDQVGIARNRGWRVLKSNGSYYEGSDSEDHIIKINGENFPDENFLAFLKEQWYGQDSILTEKTINSITTMDVSREDIKSLKGIEFFTALEFLDCSYNQLTNLDVSKNMALTQLTCSQNQLANLDVSNNTALKWLECSFNQLKSLDMSKNTALEELSCLENQLTTLDVSGSTALTTLYCPKNQLTSLDISKNTVLMDLECGGNQLNNLDVSENIALEYLKCSNNQLPSLDVSKNIALTELKCHNNQLTSLDVSKNTALEVLCCYENQLTCLDISENTALKSLECYSNLLTSLNVSKNTALTSVYCHDNKIKGEAMDAFVGSLPIQSWAKFFVVDLSNSSEENICTTLQVNTAKERGWSVLAYTDNMWIDYEGSAPSDIKGITLEKNAKTSFYDLNGRRLKKPSKNINIIDGKKVLKR